MSIHLIPLFSVEGQKQEAIKELRKRNYMMAVVYELEQERTSRIQYSYQIIEVTSIRVGQEWQAPPGWIGRVRAVIFPWEV
ncbi:hypothetical protein [Runella zeae]|uniref:hypothetical protein n=1 Tax=Runella zeae TaxID=94255 RepID=UPI000491072B|nr:hypothetical protein [Runella zeae]